MSGTGRRSIVNPTVAGIAAGIVIAFIVLVMGWININSAAPWSRTHTLTMQVSDADGIGGGPHGADRQGDLLPRNLREGQSRQ